MDKWEHKFTVFDAANGPKNVIDNLNTDGKEGWELATIVSVGSGNHLIAFLKRRLEIKMPDPTEDKKADIAKLWGGGDE
tara:strand:- start:487 stop:723 length:237 start_codon:yes stop_codon:yes gene_type:complete